jgi:hypothetical protein
LWAKFDKFLQLLRNCVYGFFATSAGFVHQSSTVDVINFMKNHSAHLQFCLWLAVCLPLPSHADIAVPNWINPKWLMAKVMDFHTKNSERYDQVQVLAQAKNTSNGAANVPSNSLSNVVSSNDPNPRKTNFAPVENASVKVNEKHLSKEELMELRKQLRQKQ